MRVRIKVLGGEEKEVETKAKTVGELLKELGYSSEEYVVARNGKILPEDEEIGEGDVLTLVPVISGG